MNTRFILTYNEEHYNMAHGQLLQTVIEDKEVRDIIKEYSPSMESTLGEMVFILVWNDYLLIKDKYPEYLV